MFYLSVDETLTLVKKLSELFFGLLFKYWKTCVPTIFVNFTSKKVLDPNGPYMSTIQTKMRNVDCLSVIPEFCLTYVARLHQPTPLYVEVYTVFYPKLS